MAKYSGKPAIINRPDSELFARMANPESFRDQLDKLPKDQLDKIGQVNFTPDSISMTTTQVGEIVFKIRERVDPTKVVFAAENSPVPLEMAINIRHIDDNSSELTTVITVNIPKIMEPMVGGTMQKAADVFGDLMKLLNE